MMILVEEAFPEMSHLHLTMGRHELPLQNYNQKDPTKIQGQKPDNKSW